MFKPAPAYIPVGRRRLGGLAASLVVHVFLAIAMVIEWPTLADEDAEAAAEEDTLAVEAVPPSALGEAMPGDESLSEEAAEPDGEPALELEGFTFDVEAIRERRDELFAFLTHDLVFLDRLDEWLRAPKDRLINPFSSGEQRTARPPLTATDEQVRATVDRAWSRRDRWKSFEEIAGLIRAHDPDAGRLPALLQHYLEANILQPYYPSATKDPRLWTMLGLAADHADFIDLVRSFARAHPSSRVTTELLFLLDELAQGSRDALLILITANPAADLERTRWKDRAAFELVGDIWRQYRGWLDERRLRTVPAINAAYDRIRIKLLETILAVTPDRYRATDARYLLGEIYFYQGDFREAQRWWRGMTPSPRDTYAGAAAEIVDRLSSRGGLSAADTHVILAGEREVWLEFSRQRLRRFGYAFDTF